MRFFEFKIPWRLIIKVFFSVCALVLFLATFVGTYLVGVLHGYRMAGEDAETQLAAIIEDLTKDRDLATEPLSTITPRPTSKPTRTSVSWGGPELWNAVNKRREEFGVNSLSSKEELCTIASIRLNELLELGKLDNHEGFSNMDQRRPDLAWIFEKYGVVAEFLAMGGESAEETVALWENTLGHKKLLDGGEYVWGCIYAQNTFAVAITAY